MIVALNDFYYDLSKLVEEVEDELDGMVPRLSRSPFSV